MIEIKMLKIRAIVLVFLTICVGSASFGQGVSDEQKATAGEQIRALRAGVLVVRLSTNARKVEALEKLVGTATTDKARHRYQGMLEDTRKETQNQNLWIMAAFRKNYNFSKLLFMPDTAAVQLKSGVRAGIFLNENVQIDPALTLGEGSFFVAYYGESSSSQTSGNEGITMADEAFHDLRYPFPFFVGRSSVRRMFERIFNKATEQEHFEQLVLKLQQTLEKYYGENFKP